jgi:hypothetical protein
MSHFIPVFLCLFVTAFADPFNGVPPVGVPFGGGIPGIDIESSSGRNPGGNHVPNSGHDSAGDQHDGPNGHHHGCGHHKSTPINPGGPIITLPTVNPAGPIGKYQKCLKTMKITFKKRRKLTNFNSSDNPEQWNDIAVNSSVRQQHLNIAVNSSVRQQQHYYSSN